MAEKETSLRAHYVAVTHPIVSYMNNEIVITADVIIKGLPNSTLLGKECTIYISQSYWLRHLVDISALPTQFTLADFFINYNR